MSALRLAPDMLGWLLLSAVLFAMPAQAQTVFTVTNTNDSGAGSLRQAITDANDTPNSSDPDEIHFGIDAQTDPGCDSGTGVCTIAVQSALPTITEAVVIDGETQAGAACGANIPSRVLTVVLDGSGAGPNISGLVITTSGSSVRGLVINQFDRSGIVFTGAGSTGNVVACSFVGTDASGTQALGMGFFGILIDEEASDNIIGGTTTDAGNLISGNQAGMFLRDTGTTGNVIQGNFIGTDATGTQDLGNTTSGVGLGMGASDNTVGGTTTAARNVIVGNQTGVRIADDGTEGNLVQGNFIGTDLTGTQAIGNDTGVSVTVGASFNTVGGTVEGAGNVISGNAFGVQINSFNTIDNLLQGNFIGTDVTGTQDLGNSQDGVVSLSGGPGNIIGGTVAGAGNIISGNDGNGIELRNGATGIVIQGNYIGTDVTGTVALGNGQMGIFLWDDAASNTIGGATAGAGNIIAANGNDGIRLTNAGTTDNLIQGNFIGTDVTGTVALSNLGGVAILGGASNNIIGGTDAGAGNLISGNLADGMTLSDFNTTGNVIQGNLIGTDATGAVALGNEQAGVRLQSGVSTTTIGGVSAEARNVISGNAGHGVELFNEGTTDNLVQGNFIGTDASGAAPLGNEGSGVIIVAAENNTIGGAAPGAGNVIAFNGDDPVADGVFVTSNTSVGNAILGNSIFANMGLGIDLGDDGPTPNDSGDGDGSPNNLQNFPDIANAFLDGGNLFVEYRVDSAPANAAYPITVEFFEADGDQEEGQTLLGRDTFTLSDFNSGDNKTVDLGNVAGVTLGDFLVATATDDDGNTSEFSFGAVEVGGPVAFTINLKRVFIKNNGKQKAKIKWNPAEINTNKLDFYIAEDPDQPDPDGNQDKRVKTSKKKIKLTVPLGGGGPVYHIQACEKNSTTVCSNVVTADFTNAIVIGPDDPDFYDSEDDDAYAGKGAAAAVPEVFALQGNAPNPFNPTTSIRVDLPEQAEVSVVVYDLLGRQVFVVPARVLEAGAGRAVEVDASHLATGAYLYRVTARTRRAVHVATGQMVLVK